MAAKVLLHQFTDMLLDQCLVFVIGEPVIEHPKTLIPPDPHHTASAVITIWYRKRETVIDSR